MYSPVSSDLGMQSFGISVSLEGPTSITLAGRRGATRSRHTRGGPDNSVASYGSLEE
jgi:hypothetical protein